MESLTYAAGSALIARQIVEELKDRGHLRSRTMYLAANFAVNFGLAISWAFLDGKSIEASFVWGVAQAVGSALYHDVKTI